MILFDVDLTIIDFKGQLIEGRKLLIESLALTGHPIHLWSGGGYQHCMNIRELYDLPVTMCHDKVPYQPKDHMEAVRKLFPSMPLLQFDDDPGEAIPGVKFIHVPFDPEINWVRDKEE